MKRLASIAGASALLLGIVAAVALHVAANRGPAGDYSPPAGALVTYFPAPEDDQGPPLVISGSIEAGFMRPFFLAFQRHNTRLSLVYIQSRNDALLERALWACKEGERTADIYLTSSTDHLVRLANENCAATLPSAIGRAAPARASWRDQVVAFTVEPAVFVFSRELDGPLPPSHVALLEWLRALPADRARVGTYDIETSADGYDLAASDSNQDALYGRLLEGLGRSDIRLYCCSNVMVDALDRREILFAYNVQLSYAYKAQRAGSRITVILPDDYQALQTLSFMQPKRARDPDSALKLAQFLVSDEARGIARQNLVPPGMTPALAAAQADRLLAQASVTPLLLSLQDRARREHLIREWREAIAPAGSSLTPASE
ncbi:MAG TPA: substrate-binding domain-containing protein [Sphingopyxis sp.]|uniref:ABC transporter substrate-binding protein n=1 Tax=Sphingopyxis sp. TaxID=1908224 RepID=UPI002BB01EB8|nr:substrate-binding domain-containing protein [Sphingopyxis sp.]HWW56300.1 substrate-binding domain-containing protein [Sphingopyxis sp.]